MELHTLLSCLHDFSVLPDQNPDIQSIEMDSRAVKPGSLFICIKGYTVDGHDFAHQAVENGAAAILSEKELNLDIPVIQVKDTKRAMAILADAFYGQPTKRFKLIGVTGTNGKTTTTHIIDKIMEDAGEKTGLIGTMYIKIGEQFTDVKNTTPESITLQKTFFEMAQKNVTAAIMEVSSHALDMGRVHGCDFDIAVFTNLTQDHLDYHHTMEDYRRAKGLLFSQLGNSFDHKKPKFSILNNDEAASSEYRKGTASIILTYGIENESDLMARNIKIGSGGTSFDLESPVGTVPVKMKMIGKFSIYNVLAAAAACLAAGITLDQIVQSIEEMDGVAGRFEAVDEGQNFTVVVDYAHTPDSLENVLKTVKEFAKGKIHTVVGCGGDRDKTKRPLMAKIAVENSDYAIFTSDNPRSEDPNAILRDMEAGVTKGSYRSIPDRKEAIFAAIDNAQENDVIVIAGKGHETYQIIGAETLDFDDRQVARTAIKQKLSE